MLESFWFSVLVGALLGILSGLGVGGGSLLILWLTAVLGSDQAAARGINLLFFLPSAAIACWFRCRQGSLKGKTIIPGLLAGTVSAAFFSWVGLRLDDTILQKGFGILLLVTGARELLYRPKG